MVGVVDEQDATRFQNRETTNVDLLGYYYVVVSRNMFK